MTEAAAILMLSIAVMAAPEAKSEPVAQLAYPGQTGDWDCTPTNFCCLLQKFEWQNTGVDPGPMSSQFLGDLSYDDGYASAPDHGFGCYVGMELARSYGACRAELCPPGDFTISAVMLEDAYPRRCAYDFLPRSAVPTFSAAVDLMKANPRAGIVLGPNSHHTISVIGVDARDRLIVIQPYPLYPGGPARVRYLSKPLGSLVWRTLTDDDVIVIFARD